MNHRDGKTVTHARSYVIPDNVAQQDAFKDKLLAVVATYHAADSLFIEDLYAYLKQYNQQIVGDDQLPLTKYALFVKACFGAAETNTYDITLMTALNFSAGLLNGDSDTVFYLISNAGMPALGFEAAELANRIDLTG